MSKRRMVTVHFRWLGDTHPIDIVPGVLLESGQVFVSHESIGIYDAELMKQEGHVLVDLDVNDKDYTSGDSNILLKLVAGAI